MARVKPEEVAVFVKKKKKKREEIAEPLEARIKRLEERIAKIEKALERLNLHRFS